MVYTVCQGPRDAPLRRTLIDPVQALEGKDVKDMLTAVGSGGGAAAAAPATGGAGGAAAGGAAAADAPAAEEKEEGALSFHRHLYRHKTDILHRERGVRRGHGFRSLRLSAFHKTFSTMSRYGNLRIPLCRL
jgi:hypothetical protein